MEVNRTLNARRYATLAATRVVLVVLALVVAARAAHEFRGTPNVWLVASLFASSAAALFIWPI
ncbi:MAG TPA: hypothetical protein VFU59_12415, partial [Candidatus Eisenbacteria bacterium]|nr:hypothetical protein [Candidatus Eisenbacteria bacterium]